MLLSHPVIPTKIEFNFHYRMCNFFLLLFEIWIDFSNKLRTFVVLMVLREAQSHKNNNEFFHISNTCFTTIPTVQLRNLNVKTLPYTGEQTKTDFLGIVPISFQFILQRTILKAGANHQDRKNDESRDQCPIGI